MSELDDMIVQSDETTEKILARLLDSNDIEMKTEIQNPLNLARLFSVADALTHEGYKSSGKLLTSFINIFLLYMTSFNRKRSTEIVTALTEALKREKTMVDKLTQPPGQT